MTATSHAKRISAAGTVVLRTRDGDQEVLLVHRPRYDDWSLPKGKVDPDEYLAGCAVRETREESGVKVRLGSPLGRVCYPVPSGQKSVDYWRGHVVRNGKHKPSSEVDEIRWLPVGEALAKLTYGDEVPMLRQALSLPETVPLLIVRHAKAMLRKYWTGPDQARPLNSRGRRQSELLVPLLSAYGVGRAVSSSSARCMQTLKPFSTTAEIDVEGCSTLSEENAKQDPASVASLMNRFAEESVANRIPMVVCGHRPVLPTMLEAIGIPPRPLQPGTALVAHLAPDASVAALEFHKPRI